jgi:hypothetical protein
LYPKRARATKRGKDKFQPPETKDAVIRIIAINYEQDKCYSKNDHAEGMDVPNGTGGQHVPTLP